MGLSVVELGFEIKNGRPEGWAIRGDIPEARAFNNYLDLLLALDELSSIPCLGEGAVPPPVESLEKYEYRFVVQVSGRLHESIQGDGIWRCKSFRKAGRYRFGSALTLMKLISGVVQLNVLEATEEAMADIRLETICE